MDPNERTIPRHREVTRHEFAGLSNVVHDLDVRVAAVESTLDAQRRNVEAFWNTHWPALMGNVERCTDALVRMEARLSKLDERVDQIHISFWRLVAALAASGVFGGAAVRAMDLIVQGP